MQPATRFRRIRTAILPLLQYQATAQLPEEKLSLEPPDGMEASNVPAYELAHLATVESNLSALQEALKGSQINAANSEGDTLLHIAAREGCKAAVNVILKSGAEPLARNKRNRTPGSQPKLAQEIKDLLLDAEAEAKERKKNKDATLWDEKMRATQTESAFGVRVV